MLELNKCEMCPHKCGVNRSAGELGRCRAGEKIEVALIKIHYDEEPCISGENGSGTVFFSKCNLNCKYCQNYKISQLGKGNVFEKEELVAEFLKLQNQNVNNINLVTPSIYSIQLIEVIKLAREKGLKIPIIYNSSGYENVENIKKLNGLIDVYLPDFKYGCNELGKKYSNINNYYEIALEAIKEMYKQVGLPEFDEKGIIKKGLIIRHLILPNNIDNSKKVLKTIRDTFGKDIFISIMSQYFPTYKANEDETINRKIDESEYNEIEDYIFKLDLVNGYMQDFEKDDNEEKYVPEF